MDYDKIFTQAIDRLHAEGRYRVFIEDVTDGFFETNLKSGRWQPAALR